MLQGCVEHHDVVCGGDKTEENTCFFWREHDADPVGALRWARDGCVGKPQVDENGDTSEKVAGVRTAGVLSKRIQEQGERSAAGVECAEA